MIELSKIILENYQVRKTHRQKTEFIELLKKELKGKQIAVEKDGVFVKTRNIVVGDIEKAKFVAGAHYDTQPVMPFPNFITPKNYIRYLGFMLIICLVFFVVFTSIYLVFAMLLPRSIFDIVAEFIPVINFCLLSLLFFGPANKHTANNNTSGVITLLEAIQTEYSEDIAFVFFDREETGLWGSRHFAKRHKAVMKDKLLINFDCVSDGDHIMFVMNKKSRVHWIEKIENAFVPRDGKQIFITKSESIIYPSDQSNFRCSVGVAAFKKNRFIGYYMDKIHTPKDVMFDERNIEFLVKGLKKLACM